MKKITNGNSTVNLSYDGFKLLEVTFEGSTNKEIYTYEGNFITEIKFVNQNNVIEYKKNYTYENNKLKTFIDDKPRYDYKTKFVYTHNTNGNVSYSITIINKLTLVETHGVNGVLTFANGVVVKDELFDPNYPSNSNVYSTGYIFEYDNKNCILKNIKGFDKLYDGKNPLFRFNNTKNYQFSKLLQNGVLQTFNNNPEVHTYTYNSLNFPTESKFYEVDGSYKGATQYFYE